MMNQAKIMLNLSTGRGELSYRDQFICMVKFPHRMLATMRARIEYHRFGQDSGSNRIRFQDRQSPEIRTASGLSVGKI